MVTHKPDQAIQPIDKPQRDDSDSRDRNEGDEPINISTADDVDIDSANDEEDPAAEQGPPTSDGRDEE